MTTFEWIQTIAALLTALGVWVGARQLFQAKQQATSQFEDSITAQYRQIIARIPLDALLGRAISDGEIAAYLRAFYEYFDLCNEQAFIAAQGRISSDTWSMWREGIQQHMARPAFQQAWARLLPDLDDTFDEFKKLLPQSFPLTSQPGPSALT